MAHHHDRLPIGWLLIRGKQWTTGHADEHKAHSKNSLQKGRSFQKVLLAEVVFHEPYDGSGAILT
jgi:hypothetical protein